MSYTAKALFDYDAVEETELSIRVDDIVFVEENNESGWCLARKGDKEGWIPTDYVEKIDDDLPPPPADVEEPPAPKTVFVPEAPTPAQKPVYVPTPQPSFEPTPAPPPAPTPPDVAQAMRDLSLATEASSPTANHGKTPTQPKPAVLPRDGAAQRICHQCKEAVESAFVIAKDKTFHADHFRCAKCHTTLGGKPFIEKDDQFYCEDDYYSAFNPKCGHCKEVIKGQYVSALDQSWHPEHFVCTKCSQPFSSNQFMKHEGKPYCEEHYRALFAVACHKCSKIIDGQVFEFMGDANNPPKKFHLACFTCEIGNHVIGEGTSFHVHNEKVFCPQHYEEHFLQKCKGCKKVINGAYIQILDSTFHPECWKCEMCSMVISADNCGQHDKKFYCKSCLSSAKAQPQVSSTPYVKPVEARPKTEAVPFRAPPKEVQQEAPEGGFPPITFFLSYPALKDNQFDPKVVDKSKKELYLSDDEFQSVLKCTKDNFRGLPVWKQKQKKQELGLF